MRPIVVAILMGMSALPSNAAEFGALLGKVLDLGCRNGRCQHAIIEKVEQVGASDGGAGKLYVVVTADSNTGVGDPQPMKNGSANVAFVFCSRTRPSVFYPSADGGSGWTTAYLHPNVGDDINDATGASYLIYFASCHHVAVSGAEQIVSLAKRLGYRVRLPDDSARGVSVPTPFAAIAPK